jgi:hypothetical protein
MKTKTEHKEMFKVKLLEIIKKNPNGFTIDFNLNPINKNKGYFIALTNNYNTDFNIAIDNLFKLKEDFKQYKDKLLIGLWLDENNKTYYLDLSIYVLNKKYSLLIGKLFNQMAIYDIKNNNCINIK